MILISKRFFRVSFVHDKWQPRSVKCTTNSLRAKPKAFQARKIIGFHAWMLKILVNEKLNFLARFLILNVDRNV